MNSHHRQKCKKYSANIRKLSNSGTLAIKAPTLPTLNVSSHKTYGNVCLSCEGTVIYDH